MFGPVYIVGLSILTNITSENITQGSDFITVYKEDEKQRGYIVSKKKEYRHKFNTK